MSDLGVESDPEKPSRYWFLKGAKHVASLPALILIMSFIGFAALTVEAGLTAWQAMFLGLSTWALPSAVVVAGAIINDVPFLRPSLLSRWRLLGCYR